MFIRCVLLTALWCFDAKSSPPSHIDYLEVFAPEGTNEYDRARTTEALTTLTAHQIQTLAAPWQKHRDSLITEDIEGHEIARVINFLAPLSPDQIKSFAGAWKIHRHAFVRPHMGGNSVVMSYLASWDPEKIGVLATYAGTLFEPDKHCKMESMINEMKTWDVHQIRSFASAWERNQHIFVREDMGRYDRDRILEILIFMDISQIDAFAEAWSMHHKVFTTWYMKGDDRPWDMRTHEYIRVMKALAPLSPEQIAELAEAWKKYQEALLIVPEGSTGSYERAEIIEALAPLTFEQIKDLAQARSTH